MRLRLKLRPHQRVKGLSQTKEEALLRLTQTLSLFSQGAHCMAIVIANSNVAVTISGENPRPVGVGIGDEYDSKDPLVKEFPWLFDPPGIEEATATPGAKRSASTKKKKAAAKK